MTFTSKNFHQNKVPNASKLTKIYILCLNKIDKKVKNNKIVDFPPYNSYVKDLYFQRQDSKIVMRKETRNSRL